MNFDALLKTANETHVCKNCKHSYIRDETETGFCKLSENAQGTTPKMITEMHTCKFWTKK